jgi:integrin beta 3
MTKFDADLFGRQMAEEVARMIGGATAPLLKRISELEVQLVESHKLSVRIDELEARAPVPGPAGRDGAPGIDGRDADPAAIERAVREAVLALPRPQDGKDGAPGRDGRDADPAVVARMVQDAVAALPAPRDGKDGRDGLDGASGLDGKDADPALIARMVQDAVAALPAPRDGKDGRYGVDGAPGLDGKDGAQGPIGPKGLQGDRGQPGQQGVRGLQGEQGLAGRDGQPGVPGRDGKDGLGFDDLDVEYDGTRTFTFRMVRGEREKAFSFTLPIVIDQGVWREQSYVKGDGVTWRGSFWIAQQDTTSKPDEASSDWRLAVKRGRDGKHAARREGVA